MCAHGKRHVSFMCSLPMDMEPLVTFIQITQPGFTELTIPDSCIKQQQDDGTVAFRIWNGMIRHSFPWPAISFGSLQAIEHRTDVTLAVRCNIYDIRFRRHDAM